MAPLPDPRPHLDAEAQAALRRITAARSHAEGRPEVSALYLAMFNNPAVAIAVGALGEQLRFRGTLPDRIREIAILRYAARRPFAYGWAHHQRPAKLAGITPETIAALARDAQPADLDRVERATVAAVDQIAGGEEIAAPIQHVLADALGDAGVVELVALCGLYGLMGYMTSAFAVEIEPRLIAPEG
ncbi:MAG: carboxymuconolactone decarboxylase family protein [Solirubrobacterales bacterium]|nr:carboxymuconolactone decarboxylase family protein [Solirubrobacterales bacterium]